ncbi:MAG: SIS domain-containing protein [Candidatus Dadabacteria bacterium]|nr:MAG: SIS domain-containing protein [Candidatus Dadabacteria bacterium]
MKKYIEQSIRDCIAVKTKVLEELVEGIEELADRLVKSYQDGGKLLLFGNGGSAADAQHIETELVHQFEMKERRCLLAIALTTNSSLLTAVGNDWSFDQVFERQVEGLATNKDVVLGLSTSGNSVNVVKGIEQGKKNGAFTAVLTGKGGGRLKDIADLSIVVPSDNTARIQESHIMIGHILCGLIEQQLFS